MTQALENFRAAPVQQVTVSGRPLRYRAFGTGPAVVLVHGWPLSGVTYRALVEALQPHYRCYVPDLPGAGDTPWWPEIRDTMSAYAAALRGFVDALQLEHFALIAHDSGGGAARLLAAELGARATCLILQNTELPGHTALQLRLFKGAAYTGALGNALLRWLSKPSLSRTQLAFGSCFGDTSLVTGEFYEACIRPLRAETESHQAILRYIDLDWTARLTEAHARIRAPIHLFWGGADRYFPLARARQMARSFVNPGEFQVIPHAKLYVHEEAPAQLAQFCLPLLSRAFTTPAARRVTT